MMRHSRVTVFAVVTFIAIPPTLVEAQSDQTPKQPGVIKAGTTKFNPKDGLKYVWIPPGTFQFGCSPGDNECGPVEKPSRPVTLYNGFWIGETPVTQAAYQRVKGTNPSQSKGDRRPVETVNWDDAYTYCSAVGMRLPTEVEWEYAARAGSTASRYGDINAIAWYRGNSGNQTHDVGQKKPNGWNLYDMLGNVDQWTAQSDWISTADGGAYLGVAPSQYPRGSEPYQSRRVRGGSSFADASDVRASASYGWNPPGSFVRIGFRCAGEVAPGETVAGTAKVNPKDGLVYVWIPQGTFQMGCSPGDPECSYWEKPPHVVTISKGFWLGQTLVTQTAYQRVQGTNPSHHQGDQRPVETVSWNDANAYCSAVGMRLPTEAEWEYAARAGSGYTRYGRLDDIAWYQGNSGNQTHEVRQKKPNDWKLYDMMGNVWHWTADWYDEKYYSHSPSQDPRGPASGHTRSQRGGSLYAWGQLVRVSFRMGQEPGLLVDASGFRCAGEALP